MQMQLERDALQPDVLPHQRRRRHRPFAPAQHADHRDVAADAAGAQRLRQRLRSADLDDVVDASSTGDLGHRASPLRLRAVVDQVIGAESPQAVELLIGRRGRDDDRPGRLGELQREQRHAAGALHQHRLASAHRAVDHQRSPCRQRGTGQGRRLRMRVSLGLPGEPEHRNGRVLAGVTIDVIAGNALGGLLRHRPVEPAREERADHRVARRQPRLQARAVDLGTDFDHDTRAIRHRHPTVVRRNLARHDSVVVVVQRAGVHAHEDFAGSGRPRLGGRHQQLLQAGRLAEADHLHFVRHRAWPSGIRSVAPV